MHLKAARHVFTRLQSWVILTDCLDKYPVLLDGKKDSKKLQIFKKMQMKIGATQTEPYLALCHKSREERRGEERRERERNRDRDRDRETVRKIGLCFIYFFLDALKVPHHCNKIDTKHIRYNCLIFWISKWKIEYKLFF